MLPALRTPSKMNMWDAIGLYGKQACKDAAVVAILIPFAIFNCLQDSIFISDYYTNNHYILKIAVAFENPNIFSILIEKYSIFCPICSVKRLSRPHKYHDQQ